MTPLLLVETACDWVLLPVMAISSTLLFPQLFPFEISLVFFMRGNFKRGMSRPRDYLLNREETVDGHLLEPYACSRRQWSRGKRRQRVAQEGFNRQTHGSVETWRLVSLRCRRRSMLQENRVTPDRLVDGLARVTIARSSEQTNQSIDNHRWDVLDSPAISLAGRGLFDCGSGCRPKIKGREGSSRQIARPIQRSDGPRWMNVMVTAAVSWTIGTLSLAVTFIRPSTGVDGCRRPLSTVGLEVFPGLSVYGTSHRKPSKGNVGRETVYPASQETLIREPAG